jgi:hypothetical protein
VLIFKWLLIILISTDFVSDFIIKIQKRHKVSECLGALIGLGLRSYVIYILITIWNV